MFTPQKVSKQHLIKSFSSGNFQNTLRKYRTALKTKSNNRLNNPSYYKPEVEQEDRVQRYIRVRQEEMMRSRSRIKRIKKNKKEIQRSRIRPIVQFLSSSVDLGNVIGSECFGEIEIRLSGRKYDKSEDVFNYCEQTKELEDQEEEVEVNDLDLIVDGKQEEEMEVQVDLPSQFDHIQVAQILPHGTVTQQSSPTQHFDPNYQYEHYMIIQPTPLPPSSPPRNQSSQVPLFIQNSNPRSESLVEQFQVFPEAQIVISPAEISSFNSSSTPNPVQVQYHCISQSSTGCILIRNKSIYYRISIRQLNKIWKQVSDLDSLMHCITNSRPHLIPVKQCIANVLANYLL